MITMKGFSYIIAFILLVIISNDKLFAQYEQIDVYDQSDTSTNYLLRKEMSGGVVLHNLGMGISFRKGKNKTYFKSRIIEVEFVSMKHPKQIRVVNPYYFNAKSYVYGKMNHVYMLRAGYGNKVLLNRKPYWGGIELRYMYMGGFTLGIAKPVYLYFWDETYSVLKEEKYDPDDYFHSSEFIYGRAPYMSGLGEIRVYPGFFAKGALNFEFGRNNTRLKALEAGAVVEYLPIPVPIMAYNPQQSLFITFYLSFHMGKRFN